MNIPDNAYAVFAVVLGCSVGIIGAAWNSKELIAFGSAVAGYGAAWFQSGKKE